MLYVYHVSMLVWTLQQCAKSIVKVMDEKGIVVMVFSTHETANKALVCARVPEKGDKCKQLKVLEWLVAALKPLKGKGGEGKCGLAQGQPAHMAMWWRRPVLTTTMASLTPGILSKFLQNLSNIVVGWY